MKHGLRALLLSSFLTALAPPVVAQWTTQNTNLPASSGIKEISAVSTTVAWAVGYDATSTSTMNGPYSRFIRTTNGGATWTPGFVTGAPAAYGFADITATDAQNAWVAMNDNTNNGGAILRTADGGASWVRQAATAFPVASGGYINGIHMSSATTGVAVGDPTSGFFEIYTTTTGGTVWNRVPAANIPTPLGGTTPEYGVAGSITGIGSSVWFGTFRGRVFRSTNGGLSWQASTTGLAEVNQLEFADALNGIAYDDIAPNNISRTTDGGATWTLISSSGTAYPTGLSAVPGTAGAYVSVGVGSSYSSNSGTTWRPLTPSLTHTTVAFANAQGGWAGGVTGAGGTGGIYFSSLPTPPLPTPEWVWANRVGDFSDDIGQGMAVDGSGNVYACGRFQGVATFGTTTIVSNGLTDMYLVKYTAQGNVVWVRQAGGVSDDNAWSLALDGSGNVYVTGQFTGSASFDSQPVTSVGGADLFLAKYSAAGSLQWVRTGGSTLADRGSRVALDGSGNAYVAGNFQGTATFGPNNLFSRGGTDAVLLKYSPAGTVLWARQGGGSTEDTGAGVAVTSSGQSYLTGVMTGTAMFGTTTLVGDGSNDLYLASYDAQGTVQWVRQAGSSGDDGGNRVGVDGSGNIYLAGFYTGTVTVGSQTLSSSGGTSDVLVAKYSPAGIVQWARTGGGADGIDSGYDIFTDVAGNSYVTGFFTGTATFGALTLVGTANEVYVAKYDNAGTLQWVQTAGGSGNDISRCVAVDGAGNAYITGQFQSTADFGLAGILTSVGGYDIFVGKIGTNCALTTPTVTAAPVCAGQTLTLLATNVPGGTTLRWTGPNGFTSTQATATVPNATLAASGTYTLTATSASQGCSVTASVTVSVDAVPAAPIASPARSCGPAALTLTATGTPAGGSYRWYTTLTGGTPISGATGDTYTTPPLSVTTTYYVSAVSVGGCEGPRTSNVATIQTVPAPTLTATGATTFCQGGSVMLTAASGGPGVTYQFLLNGVPVSSGSGTSFSATAPGAYTVVATLPSGCTGTSNPISVTVSNTPGAPTGTNATRCGTGAVTLTASGAPAGASYRWYTSSTGGSPISGATGPTYTTPSLSATTVYYVSAVAAGGCEGPRAVVTAVIASAPIAAITTSGPTTICQGSSVTLTASTGTSYQWSNGLTTPSITVSTGGTYFVTVTNAQGCAATSAAVSVSVTPQASAAFAYGASTYCLGSGSATPTITGTTGGTFSVSPAGLTINAATGVLNLAASQAGTYTVTYAVGGLCPASATTSLSLITAPLAGFAYPVTSACAGTVATLLPTLAAGASAGTFTAAPGGLMLDPATGMISLANSQAGTYIVTNTVVAGGTCPTTTGTGTFTVLAVPPTPTITPTGTNPITLTSSAASGNQWFYNGQPIVGATGMTYVVSTAAQNGSYTVQTTGTGGCASAVSASVNVTVTGLGADLPGTSLALYPNPTPDGRMTLALQGYGAPIRLTLMDAIGQTVYHATLAGGTTRHELALRDLPGGVYLLRAESAAGTVIRRLVRE